MNGGGIRGGKIYPPGATITRRDVLAELPFDNRLVTIKVSGAALRPRSRTGCRNCPARRPLSPGLGPHHRGRRQPPARQPCHLDEGRRRAARSRTDLHIATNDFMAGGGDDYVMFRDIEPVLPVADSPTLAYEVIDYIVSIGTVRTVVEGRIVVK